MLDLALLASMLHVKSIAVGGCGILCWIQRDQVSQTKVSFLNVLSHASHVGLLSNWFPMGPVFPIMIVQLLFIRSHYLFNRCA
jgi:hypothetical protein